MRTKRIFAPLNPTLTVLILSFGVLSNAQLFSVEKRLQRSNLCSTLDQSPGVCVAEQDCPQVTEGLYFPSFCEKDDNEVGVCCKLPDQETSTVQVSVTTTSLSTTTLDIPTTTIDNPTTTMDDPARTLDDPAITSTSKTTLDFEEIREEDPFLKPEDAESRKEKCGRISFYFPDSESQVQVGSMDWSEVLQPRLRTIVGGDIAAEQSLPWTVALGTTDTGAENFFCGGTLISNRFVLTAAHCIEALGANPVLLLGTTNLSDSLGIRRKMRRSILHPAWSNIPGVPQDDLALVELDYPIELNSGAEPICLPSPEIDIVNRTGLVSGWGRLLSNGPTSTLLRVAEVTVLDRQSCIQVYGEIFSAGSGLVCARGKQLAAGEDKVVKAGYVTDACQGDSGGGLFLEEEDHTLLIGVVSGGVGCGLEKYPGIYVDVRAYLGWILEYVTER